MISTSLGPATGAFYRLSVFITLVSREVCCEIWVGQGYLLLVKVVVSRALWFQKVLYHHAPILFHLHQSALEPQVLDLQLS